jgi:hypothetical protein
MKWMLVGISILVALSLNAIAGERYSVSFVQATSLIVPGAQHQLGTPEIFITCYDAKNTIVEADSVSVDPTTLNVTINFAVPQDGKCVLRK